jgi:hypothetical protein
VIESARHDGKAGAVGDDEAAFDHATGHVRSSAPGPTASDETRSTTSSPKP